ncbi:dihydroneopterin aldolase [Angustibacter sp. McL0619]|uniref:dihydroneopterin aldolase n=1 Tax=Angustibacter sp. McL0619 TaxID=3415676 RepID=UPI003CF40CFD
MSADVGPVLDADGRPLDRVALQGLRARGRHGVLDFEKALGQEFVVDVVLHLDSRAAAAGDDLTHTVHYGELAEQVVAVVSGEPVELIETLAQRLADVALASPLVVAADVTVHKPQAPVTVPFGDVSVSIRRWRR